MRPLSIRSQQCLLCELRQFAGVFPSYHSFSALTTTTASQNLRTNQSLAQSRQGQKRSNTIAGSPIVPARRVENSKQASPLRSPLDLDSRLRHVTQNCRSLISSSHIPPELSIVELLKKYQELAHIIAGGRSQGNTVRKNNENTATSALLSLQAESYKLYSSTGTPGISDSFKKQAVDSLVKSSTQLLRDPKVFITPAILDTYTSIQTSLGRPEYLPEIFSLYAVKPIPKPSSSPITYSEGNPKSHKNAIPKNIADRALEAAIARKNLPLVLSVIDNTYCAPAFYRNKILRKAGVPIAGLSLAPVASYAVASYFAENYQNTMDPAMATNLAFAAIISYIGFTAVIGIVAVTTANDQMVRVTWASGMPLRERWLREEERAALDKVAMAWGFKEEWKRGMEEGLEWESLREFIGRRGMVLDATNLMVGME